MIFAFLGRFFATRWDLVLLYFRSRRARRRPPFSQLYSIAATGSSIGFGVAMAAYGGVFDFGCCSW